MRAILINSWHEVPRQQRYIHHDFWREHQSQKWDLAQDKVLEDEVDKTAKLQAHGTRKNLTVTRDRPASHAHDEPITRQLNIRGHQFRVVCQHSQKGCRSCSHWQRDYNRWSKLRRIYRRRHFIANCHLGLTSLAFTIRPSNSKPDTEYCRKVRSGQDIAVKLENLQGVRFWRSGIDDRWCSWVLAASRGNGGKGDQGTQGYLYWILQWDADWAQIVKLS